MLFTSVLFMVFRVDCNISAFCPTFQMQVPNEREMRAERETVKVGCRDTCRQNNDRMMHSGGETSE